MSKNAKSLKNSYIYSTFIDTSNPNRSALINKSLINARKHYSSDSELPDEIEEGQETPQEMPGSILGSVRSGYLESVRLINSEDSTRHERTNSNQGAHQQQMLLLSLALNSKLTSTDRNKDREKVSTADNSNRNLSEKELGFKAGTKSSSKLQTSVKKPSIKLDLSSVLKTNSPKPNQMSSKFQDKQLTGSSNKRTSNISWIEGLNFSQIKHSPAARSFIPETPESKGTTKVQKALTPKVNTDSHTSSVLSRGGMKGSGDVIASRSSSDHQENYNTYNSVLNSLREEIIRLKNVTYSF